MLNNCLNCDAHLAEECRFCPRCGQKTGLHRLSLHDILHDAMHFFLHADKSFLQLLRSLSVRTGVVAKEFTSGKRKRYFPPLNFFLIVGTIFVLIVSAAYIPGHRPDVLTTHPELKFIPDPAHRAGVMRIFERQEIAMYFINKYSNFISMLAVPLIAFIYWLFYYRGKYNYTEHLVAGMYMGGFTNLIYAVVFVPLSLLLKGNNSTVPLGLVGIFMFIQVAYNSIFYYRFMDKLTRVSFYKAFGVAVFTAALWFALSGFLVGAYIRSGFWGIMH